MPAFCSLCVSDEYTSEGVEPDGQKYVFCANVREHGADGYRWNPTVVSPKGASRGGLGAELDIWDKLLDCIPSDGTPHSYGEVEDQLFESYPADAALLQERFGHVWRGGKRSENQYSMSVYLALRLSELAREGSVALTWGPAEGPWAYNGTYSYWAKE
jgi:hypothetical protein